MALKSIEITYNQQGKPNKSFGGTIVKSNTLVNDIVVNIPKNLLITYDKSNNQVLPSIALYIKREDKKIFAYTCNEAHILEDITNLSDDETLAFTFSIDYSSSEYEGEISCTPCISSYYDTEEDTEEDGSVIETEKYKKNNLFHFTLNVDISSYTDNTDEEIASNDIIETLLNKFDKYYTQVVENTNDIKDLQNRDEELNELISTNTFNISQLSNSIMAINDRADGLEERIETNENNITTINTNIEALDERITTNESDIDSLQEYQNKYENWLATFTPDITSTSTTTDSHNFVITNNKIVLDATNGENIMLSAPEIISLGDYFTISSKLRSLNAAIISNQLTISNMNSITYSQSSIDYTITLQKKSGTIAYLDDIEHKEFQIYDSYDDLPETGLTYVIYLVGHGHQEETDNYDEYVWIESLNKYEKIGNTDIDLSDYYKKSEIDEQESSIVSTIPTTLKYEDKKLTMYRDDTAIGDSIDFSSELPTIIDLINE